MRSSSDYNQYNNNNMDKHTMNDAADALAHGLRFIQNNRYNVIESLVLKPNEVLFDLECNEIAMGNVHPIFFLRRDRDIMESVDYAIKYALSKVHRQIDQRVEEKLEGLRIDKGFAGFLRPVQFELYNPRKVVF